MVSVGLYVCGTCYELPVVSDDLFDLILVGGFAGLAFLFSDLWGVDLPGCLGQGLYSVYLSLLVYSGVVDLVVGWFVFGIG